MAMAGRDKAMMLLSFLGGDTSQKVLQYLSPENAEQIAGEVNNLPNPSPEALEEILHEVTEQFPKDADGMGAPPLLRSDPRPPALAEPMVELAARLANERTHILAFIAAELPESDREQFLGLLPDRRREIEQLMKQQHTSPI